MMNIIQNALSGLLACQKKVEASASNIANLQTTGSLDDPENAPYTPITTAQKSVTDADGNGLGVQSEFVPKNQPFVPAYDPGSPFADSQGLIGVPNINLAEEAVNLKLAEITFKANIKVLETASELSDELLNTFDEKV